MAEANAGGQRCGGEGGGRVAERARVMAEHGVVVAGSDGIASVGVAGGGGAAAARNSAADCNGGGAQTAVLESGERGGRGQGWVAALEWVGVSGCVYGRLYWA